MRKQAAVAKDVSVAIHGTIAQGMRTIAPTAGVGRLTSCRSKRPKQPDISFAQFRTRAVASTTIIAGLMSTATFQPQSIVSGTRVVAAVLAGTATTQHWDGEFVLR